MLHQVVFISYIQILSVQYAVCGFAFFQQNPFVQQNVVSTSREPRINWSSATHSLLSSESIRSESCFILTSTSRQMGKPQSVTINWLPSTVIDNEIINYVDAERDELQVQSIEYLADLIKAKLMERNASTDEYENEEIINSISEGGRLAKSRFKDLTCTKEGEKILEDMFNTAGKPELEEPEHNTIRGSIVCFQSLVILGTQVGVKGTPKQLQNMVSHLYHKNDDFVIDSQDFDTFWKQQSSRQLKHRVDITAGKQLLAELRRKRTSQGAFDLLVELGVWSKHEDLALLRSGFPLRFSEEELRAAIEVQQDMHDPDALLGLRKDLRKFKVYTIDKKSTKDVDDGISIETVHMSDGSKRNRIWIHIADADHWSPRNTDIFQAAQQRATSLYLPTGSVPMFPPDLGFGAMSLGANSDSYALSLSVELNEDGSIDTDSLQLTPSLINVKYRLSYDEVDEMFDDGVAYFEESDLGALLAEANKRRKFRITNGSIEGFIPNSIPNAEVEVLPDENEEDNLRINVKVEVSHNGSFNQTSTVDRSKAEEYTSPVSAAFLMVTEIMILAGEAMGKYGIIKNNLLLPYRTQAKTDFAERYQELDELESLRDEGDGYCHAWYARRFFNPINIVESPRGHAGLGLDCYVQWTSPIRRFGDLQVHAAVKRYLRKKKLIELMRRGEGIPSKLTSSDLGCTVPRGVEDLFDEGGKYKEYVNDDLKVEGDIDVINFKKGVGLLQAARIVQRKSKQYWMFEYLRRKQELNTEAIFEGVVLGCVDSKRFQYAIYVHELGLEHRYLSEAGRLNAGETVLLKVASVYPHYGLLTFTMAKL